MFARLFASRRVRRAEASFRAAYAANVNATLRQDTRVMHDTRAALRAAQHERMAAEVALARAEGSTLRRAA